MKAFALAVLLALSSSALAQTNNDGECNITGSLRVWLRSWAGSVFAAISSQPLCHSHPSCRAVTALAGLQSCIQASKANIPYVNGWGVGLSTGSTSSAGRKLLQTAENCAQAAAISTAIRESFTPRFVGEDPVCLQLWRPETPDLPLKKRFAHAQEQANRRECATLVQRARRRRAVARRPQPRRHRRRQAVVRLRQRPAAPPEQQRRPRACRPAPRPATHAATPRTQSRGPASSARADVSPLCKTTPPCILFPIMAAGFLRFLAVWQRWTN